MQNTGIKYVSKANMWQFYIKNMDKDAVNTEEWYQSEAEAQERLTKYEQERV